MVDRAAIGMAVNRPYAMKAVTPPSTRFTGKEKVGLAAHDVKYSCEDHDQRQADGRIRRELRLDSGHRRKDQADASQKLTDSDEDKQALRHR